MPFVGLIEEGRRVLAHQMPNFARLMLELPILVAFSVAVVWAFRGQRGLLQERLSWLAAAALASSLTILVWVTDASFMRGLTEYYVLGCAILLGSRTRVVLPVFALMAVSWVAVARIMVTFPF
jgi:hypothetical protein